MPESITQRLNAAPFSSAEARELAALIGSVRTDLNALRVSLNQLITDYNANATIATDTTAAAVTLNTTA
jgi:hypothetical protein